MKRFKNTAGATLVVTPIVVAAVSMLEVRFSPWFFIFGIPVAVFYWLLFAPDNNFHDGSVIGYKKLVIQGDLLGRQQFYSPVYKTLWKNNKLSVAGTLSTSDRHGIYLAKYANDPQLKEYEGTLCKIRGTGYIEYEFVYKVEQAEVIEVL